jgi:hypothetical protein
MAVEAVRQGPGKVDVTLNATTTNPPSRTRLESGGVRRASSDEGYRGREGCERENIDNPGMHIQFCSWRPLVEGKDKR